MSTNPWLYRSTLEIRATEGRTLSGIAVPWDRPTMVRDLTGPPYPEAFAPTSADVSIRQRGTFPMFRQHDWRDGAMPVGSVIFSRSAEALVFEALASKTRDGDEALELVNDGAMRSVSVGFKPIKTTMRQWALGKGQYRTEVQLRELSLAPTGFGQYAEAGVLAVRDSLGADVTFDAQADAVGDAIEKSLNGIDGTEDGPQVELVDITDSWAVYSIEGGPLDEPNVKRSLFRVDYTTNADGTVSLSVPTAVQVAYEPTGRSEPPTHAELKRRANITLPALR